MAFSSRLRFGFLTLMLGLVSCQTTGVQPNTPGTILTTTPDKGLSPEVSDNAIPLNIVPTETDKSTKETTTVNPGPTNEQPQSVTAQPEQTETTTTTTTASPFTAFGNEMSAAQMFQEQCAKPSYINRFCILPTELTSFFHPNATLNEISRYFMSDEIIEKLVSECKPGEWCLSAENDAILEEKLEFWTNSSDFDKLCSPDFWICLDYISGFYFDCDKYELYHLMTTMDTLLCKMKKEPKASPNCIKQTIKILHVSMADSQRPIQDFEASELLPECQTRRGKMTKEFVCTTALCDKYSALLYEFEPWQWFTKGVEQLKTDCSLDSEQCLTEAEEDTMDDIISSVIKDEQKVYEKNWILEQMSMRAVIVIAIVSVAAIGAFSLVIFVVWRKRKMRVRVRDGMEYLEIKPEETDAFLESIDEICDNTKLITNN